MNQQDLEKSIGLKCYHLDNINKKANELKFPFALEIISCVFKLESLQQTIAKYFPGKEIVLSFAPLDDLIYVLIDKQKRDLKTVHKDFLRLFANLNNYYCRDYRLLVNGYALSQSFLNAGQLLDFLNAT